MKNALSSLAVAAALFAAALPAAARADHGGDRRAPPPPAHAYAYPAPPARPAYDFDHDRAPHRDGYNEHARIRELRARAAERERLRVELARLDADRDAFHARWGWNARKVFRYDRWYADRRAELLRRYDALAPRPHAHAYASTGW